MELNALWAVALVFIVSAMLFFARRTKRSAHRVEEYSLSVEERNGFPFVQLKLQTNDGQHTFELDPNYSHVLSDELLTASAKAIRSAHAPSH